MRLKISELPYEENNILITFLLFISFFRMSGQVKKIKHTKTDKAILSPYPSTITYIYLFNARLSTQPKLRPFI